MRRSFLLGILFGLVALAPQIRAQKIFNGKITYLTSTSAYVDLGTNHGFDVGDTLFVVQKDKHVAVLRVATIASKSLSAAILSKEGTLKEGDEVRGATMRSPKTIERTIVRDTILPPPASSAQPTQANVAEPSPLQTTVVNGRFGVQYYAMYNGTARSLDFSQPAAVLNFTVDKILGAPLAFDFYVNSRYDARRQELRSGSDYPRMTNRVYDASLRYGTDASLLSFQMGRFIAPVIGGVGTFDGGMITVLQSGVQMGIVAGTQPGWKNSEVQLSAPKFAAFVSTQSGDYRSAYYQGSVAYAQQYYAKALDRGFIYLQNSVTFSNSLSLYQNANVDLHDIVGAERKVSPHLSDFFLSASYRPFTWLSTSGSYAIRRNIYFLESFKGIPDSLFDKSFLQNVQLSLGFRLPFTLYLTTTGAIRKKEGDTRAATSLLANLSWADIAGSQIGAYISGNIADNVYNKSSSIGIDVHRDFFDDIYLSMKARRYFYNYSSSNRTIARTTVGTDILYRVSKAIYSTLSYERYFEESSTTDRLYIETSLRF